jgi:release factor glutamine methyltransferase
VPVGTCFDRQARRWTAPGADTPEAPAWQPVGQWNSGDTAAAHPTVVSHTVTVPADQPFAELVISRLAAAGCVAADEEAEELLAAAPDVGTLEGWIERREQGEPLAWITGTQQFCGRTLRVDPGVYVPRLQSEELARRASALLGVTCGWAADLCTGAGAIASHMTSEVPTATVVGVDIDVRAVVCARRNGVHALAGDLDRPLRSRVFDVVTAVAPYVPTDDLRLLPSDVQRYEPRRSLDGGADGLELVRRIVTAAARLLRPDGWLLLELGGDQDIALNPTLTASGFHAVDPWFDVDGDLRGLTAQASRSVLVS